MTWVSLLILVAGVLCLLAALADAMHARQSLRASLDRILERQRLQARARSWPESGMVIGNKPGGGIVTEDIITKQKGLRRWRRRG